MNRNSGIIGLKNNPTSTSTSGIYDTFDQYNSKRLGQWPIPLYYQITVDRSPATFNQGETIVCTVVTENVAAGTTLYWTLLDITGSSSNDFLNGISNGSITVSVSGVNSINAALRYTATGTERTFALQLRTTSTSGPVVATSNTITLRSSVLSITPLSSSVNESNSQVTFRVNGTNITGTPTIFYTLTGTGITGADFQSGSTTGSFVMNSGGANTDFIVTVIPDSLTEGTESFVATVQGLQGVGGYTSSSVTISDTSQNPTATVTPNVSTVNEGSSVTFTVNTTNFSSGTLYWSLNTVSGTINSNDFSPANVFGSFSISNSTGSVVLTLSNDVTTEGSESFQLQVRTNSAVGTVIGTSSTVTISDTSLATSGGSYTYAPGGDATFTGEYTFTVPAGVTSLCMVAVGGGGSGGPSGVDASSGGGGGGLCYINNLTVSPGETFKVFVAGQVSQAPGEASFVEAISSSLYPTGTKIILANGGGQGLSGTYSSGGVGGGSNSGLSSRVYFTGGAGGGSNTLDSTNGISEAGAGGGAAGYSGNGGNGRGNTQESTDGSGGGGGGGGSPDSGAAGGGGGVGLRGQGTSGLKGTNTSGGRRGGGGSFDTTFDGGENNFPDSVSGGHYGGGGAGSDSSTAGTGTRGAVRIIWGSGRSFPNNAL